MGASQSVTFRRLVLPLCNSKHVEKDMQDTYYTLSCRAVNHQAIQLSPITLK